MPTTWILLIAIVVVLYLVMRRRRGGHGSHGGHQSTGRGHTGHGCGHGTRDAQSGIDARAADAPAGASRHRHG